MTLLNMTPEQAREWAKLEEGCLVTGGRLTLPEVRAALASKPTLPRMTKTKLSRATRAFVVVSCKAKDTVRHLTVVSNSSTLLHKMVNGKSKGHVVSKLGNLR